MKIKPGTVMLAVPTVGAPQHECFVCTGPKSQPGHEREMAGEAFIVGVCAGINAMQGGYRPKLCIDHETRFRETLAGMVAPDAALCERLGIECKVAE